MTGSLRTSKYLQLLPRVYRRADEGGDGVLGRFLLAFEDILTSGYRRDHRGDAKPTEAESVGETVPGIEQILDNLTRNFAAATTPHTPDDPATDFLAWLFENVGLEWYGDLEEPELRRLLDKAVRELYPRRGTRDGIRRYLQLAAHAEHVDIRENVWPTNMQIGAASTIGRDTLLSDRGMRPRDHCFVIDVALRWNRLRRQSDPDREDSMPVGQFREVLERRVHRILRRERPAHTRSFVRIRMSTMQLGCSSTVGVDTALA